MFNLGFTEILVVVVLGIILLGPKRLPVAAGVLGRVLRDFRKVTQEFRHHLEESLDIPETPSQSPPALTPKNPIHDAATVSKTS